MRTTVIPSVSRSAAWDFMSTYRGPAWRCRGPRWRRCSARCSMTTVPARRASSRELLPQGRVPASPRFALQIVDVRDLADLHVRAMMCPGLQVNVSSASATSCG